MATPPTFVASYASAFSGSVSPKTVSVTRNTGDIIVVAAWAENSAGTYNTPTLNGVTFTLQQSQSGGSQAELVVWTGVATTSETSNLSISASSPPQWGFVALRFSGSDGVGATSSGNNATGSGAPSLALTTTGDNSAVICFNADWNAVSTARTWRTINSVTPTLGNGLERAYEAVSGAYTVYAAYWNDAGTAGAKTTGLSAPTTQRYVIAAIEVLGVSSTPPNTGTVALTAAVDVAATGRSPRRGTADIEVDVDVVATGDDLISLWHGNDTPANVDPTNSPLGIVTGTLVLFGQEQDQLYLATLYSEDGHFVSTVGDFGTAVGDIDTVYAPANGENVSTTAPSWTTVGNGVFEDDGTDVLPATALNNKYFVSPVLDLATQQVVGIRFRASVTISGNYNVSLWKLNKGSLSVGTRVATKAFTSAALKGGLTNTILFDTPYALAAQGSADVGVEVALTASGIAPGVGDATGTANVGVAIAVAATGGRKSQGSANVAVAIDLAATGRAKHQGSANVGVAVTVAGTGDAPGENSGTANVGVVINVAASGAVDVAGSTDVPITFTVNALGNAPTVEASEGTIDVGISFDITAVGVAVTRLIPIRQFTPDEILTGNRSTKYRLEILDLDDNPIEVLNGVTDGHIDWTANAMVKGAGSLRVQDVHQPINWLTVRLRPVMVIEGLPPQPLGVYLASEAPDSWDKGRSWSIKMLDKTTILDQDTISTTFGLDAGVVVTDQIRTIVEGVGITNHAITASTKTLRSALVWEPGTSKLRIINDLLSAINYFSLYSNFEGQLIAEPYILPAQRPTIYEFIDGEKSIYSPRFTGDADLWSIPNRVTAIGMGDGVTPALTSTLDNTNPDSPYSIPSRGRVVGYVETGVEAADQVTLDEYVQRKLVSLTSPTSSVKIQHAPVPGLAVNQIVRFRRVPAGIDHRHSVYFTSLTLRGNALAQSTLRQVVDL